MRISDWSSDVCSSDLVAGQVAGLNLSQGLSGFATCDGETVLLPLVSQSGMEKMTVRLWLSGRYTAEMRVEMADPAQETALGAMGFARVGDVQMLNVEGSVSSPSLERLLARLRSEDPQAWKACGSQRRTRRPPSQKQ